MNAPDKFFLPDVQASADHRALPIQRVGVRGLRYPLAIAAAGGTVQHTVATIEMTVGLAADQKGTHMSRFVELLEAQHEALDLAGVRGLFADMLQRLEASSGRIEARFPWFVRKQAPVSGVASLLDMDATVIVEQTEGGSVHTRLQAVVPVIEGDDEAVLGARVLAQEHRIYAQAVRWFVDGRLRLDEAGRVRVADAVFDAQAGCIVPALDAGGGRE